MTHIFDISGKMFPEEKALWERRCREAGIDTEEQGGHNEMAFRPWDRRFLYLAKHISGWSKDPSTQVGAVIAREDRTIASLGFNGFPRGIEDPDFGEVDRSYKLERMIHAEMNALLFLRGENVTDGHTLYTWPFLSCHRCAVHVIQVGIKRVVAPAYNVDRWMESLELSRRLFKEAGVSVVEIKDDC